MYAEDKFEKLGYEKYDKGELGLFYIKKRKGEYRHIAFHTNKKSKKYKTFDIYTGTESNLKPTKLEEKAINKQLEELGWY